MWLVGAPLSLMLGALSEQVSRPLADDAAGVFSLPMLAPLNSVGAALALSLLALRVMVKRLLP